MTRFSRADTEALATFTRRLRPDWNHPGIVSAIEACRDGSLSEVAVALIRLAEDGSVTTPALLPRTGRHWTRAGRDDAPAGPNTRNRDLCPLHGEDRATCPQCKAETGEPVRPGFVADLIASLPKSPASHRERTIHRSDPARLDHLRNRMETQP
jgi:hypothetical protein